MGSDFRSEEGVSLRFDLRDFLDVKSNKVEFQNEYLKGRRGCYGLTSRRITMMSDKYQYV